MLRRIGIIILAVVFMGSMSWAPMVDTVHAAAKCECGKDCKCEHCKTGKGECQCKGEGKEGCKCGKDCGCEHCKTGKGECKCGKGDGKSGCKCKSDGKGGCQCGKDCKCEHCKTGKGECQCKGDGKGGCKCGKDCGCEHCARGAAAEKTKPASDADYAKSMKSKAGTFMATYTSDPEAIPVGKIINWKLKVETADGKAVTDAKITVDGAMPEHGHGLPTQPKVKSLGDGSYLVEGIKFSMPGWWTMTFSIKAGGKSDKVTFNLQLK
jgi:hypothetical protein